MCSVWDGPTLIMFEWSYFPGAAFRSVADWRQNALPLRDDVKCYVIVGIAIMAPDLGIIFSFCFIFTVQTVIIFLLGFL